jgi:hypothetical protein
MAVTKASYTGDGSTVLFSIPFPYIQRSDIVVLVNSVSTSAFTFANATTIQFNVAPLLADSIEIVRETDTATLRALLSVGSSLRASDLNNNFIQGLYVAQESTNVSQEAFNEVQSAKNNAAAAVVTANAAQATSIAAASTANSAVIAVTASVFYQPVVDLAALALLSPNDGTFYELQNSSGAENSSSIIGVPPGFIGDPGLSMRMRYDSGPAKYVFISYISVDSETRYIKNTSNALTDFMFNFALRGKGIGLPGGQLFGVGPAVISTTPVGLGPHDYFPIDLPSGSFM